MILTGKEIEQEVNEGRIVITPFIKEQLNPNSYNLRLGDEILVYDRPVLDMAAEMPVKRLKIPAVGMLLAPGQLYLGHTIETIGSSLYVPVLDGRSSTGRLGINIHATAGYGDLGFFGTFTLEISVIHPVWVYPRVQVCQVSFHKIFGNASLQYKGKYDGQSGPRKSGLWKEFRGSCPN